MRAGLGPRGRGVPPTTPTRSMPFWALPPRGAVVASIEIEIPARTPSVVLAGRREARDTVAPGGALAPYRATRARRVTPITRVVGVPPRTARWLDAAGNAGHALARASTTTSAARAPPWRRGGPG